MPFRVDIDAVFPAPLRAFLRQARRLVQLLRALLRTVASTVLLTTVDIIRLIEGRFISNIGTPARYSRNAAIGRLLRKYADILGIRLVAKGLRVKDDNGHWTTTAVWAIVGRPLMLS